MAFVSIFSTCVALLGLYYLIDKWGSVKAISVTYIVPIIALVIDSICTSTIPKYQTIIEIIIVLAGTIIIQFNDATYSISKKA